MANSWIIINVGGGPTDDKPEVTLETPPDPNRVSSFLNIGVADIGAVYSEWSARGADLLTLPKQHQNEIRRYIRDPDGDLIEVGQTTDPTGRLVAPGLAPHRTRQVVRVILIDHFSAFPPPAAHLRSPTRSRASMVAN